MVYDTRSNFVGDTHWREKSMLEEGEELELERGGILVEVQECLGKQDQDLTELIDKRVKERVERAAARSNEGSPLQTSAAGFRPQSIPAAHLMPKPLNAIIGTPTGHYGRALVSNASPYEQRQISNGGVHDENEDPRPAKRRKQNDSPPRKNGYAQSLMGTTLVFSSSRPPSTATIRHEPLKLKSIQPPKPPIDLTMEEDEDEDGEDEGQVARQIRQEGQRRLTEKLSAKTRMRRQDRSPPPRSGYASNLTGASLSLSRPNVASSSAVQKPLDSVHRCRDQIIRPVELSSSDGSSREIEAKALPKAKPLKSKDRMVQKPQVAVKSRMPPSEISQGPSSNSLGDINSETLPNVNHPKPKDSSIRQMKTAGRVPEQSKRQRIAPEPSPVLKHVNGKSHTALRIKSRPRSQMMMLMDRPSPRPSTNTSFDSTDSTSKRSRNKPKAPAQKAKETAIVASLGSLSQTHEDSLEVPDEDLGMFTGDTIDYHTIDALLSRKRVLERTSSISSRQTSRDKRTSSADARKASGVGNKLSLASTHIRKIPETENGVALVVEKIQQAPDLAMATSKEDPTSFETSTARRPILVVETNTPVKKSTDTLKGLRTDSRSNRTNEVGQVAKPPDLVVQEHIIAPPQNLSTVIDTVRSQKDDAKQFNGSISINNSPLESASNSLIDKPGKSAVQAPIQRHSLSLPTADTLVLSLSATSDQRAFVSAREQPPSAQPLLKQAGLSHGDLSTSATTLQYVSALSNIPNNGSFLESTDLRPSSLPRDNREDAVILTTDECSSRCSSRQPDPTRSESVFSDSKSRQATKSSPSFPLELGRNNLGRDNKLVSANDIQGNEGANGMITTGTTVQSNLAQVRLANPATRGRPIQRAVSKAMETTAPGIRAMPQPTPMVDSCRPDQIAAGEDNVGKEIPIMKGPWSTAESFDLFGKWKPPGRDV